MSPVSHRCYPTALSKWITKSAHGQTGVMLQTPNVKTWSPALANQRPLHKDMAIEGAQGRGGSSDPLPLCPLPSDGHRLPRSLIFPRAQLQLQLPVSSSHLVSIFCSLYLYKDVPSLKTQDSKHNPVFNGSFVKGSDGFTCTIYSQDPDGF